LAGLLTGGGYGPLLPRFGLALDNLLGAEIVLADGQIVFVDSSQNSDLDRDTCRCPVRRP
jgi:FAD/FMN-containing dehydrogenase